MTFYNAFTISDTCQNMKEQDVINAFLTYVRGVSFFKAVGLGFKTPLEAKEGTYIDKKCPWTGNISIRGKLLRGVVVSTKMKRYVPTHSSHHERNSKFTVFSGWELRFCVAVAEPWLFAAITSITSRSTIVMRRGTRISPLTSPRP